MYVQRTYVEEKPMTMFRVDLLFRRSISIRDGECYEYDDFRNTLQERYRVPKEAEIYYFHKKEKSVVDSQESLVKFAKFAAPRYFTDKETVALVYEEPWLRYRKRKTSGTPELNSILGEPSLVQQYKGITIADDDILEELTDTLTACTRNIFNDAGVHGQNCLADATRLEDGELEKPEERADKLENENASLQSDNRNDTPPAWFKEYMDSLKKDIGKEVSNEVTKNVLNVLSKRTLESSISIRRQELGRSTDRKHSVSSNRCSPCYHLCVQSELKKKLRAMKDGRNAETRIKHDKKPHNAKSKKKREERMASKYESRAECLHEKKRKLMEEKMAFSQLVETMNDLGKSSVNREAGDAKAQNTRITKTQEEILQKMEKRCNRRLEFLRERKRMISEMKSTVMGMKTSYDLVTATRNNLDNNGHCTNIVQSSTQEIFAPQRSLSLSDLQLDNLHGGTEEIAEIIKRREDILARMERESERQVTYLREKDRMLTDMKIRYGLLPESPYNMDKGKGQEGNNETRNISLRMSGLSGSRTKLSLDAQTPSLSNESNDTQNCEKKSEAPSNTDTKFCTNYVATEHSMPDNTHTNAFMISSGSENDNISMCSDGNLSDLNDEEKFELLQLPSSSGRPDPSDCADDSRKQKSRSDSLSDTSDIERLEYEECENFKDVNDDSNRESPSFEILSETQSPPPVSIYVDEDHFSTTENISPTMNVDRNLVELNLERGIVYVVDVNGKVYNNKQLTNDSERCLNTYFGKQTNGNYCFTGERMAVKCKEPFPTTVAAKNTERGSTFACDSNMDVGSSHTAYPTNARNMKATRAEDTLPQCSHSHQSQTNMGDFSQRSHLHATSMIAKDIQSGSVAHPHTRKDFTKHGPRRSKKMYATKIECERNEVAKTNQQDFGVVSDPVQILPEALINKVTRAAIATSGNWRGICDKLRSLTGKPERLSSGGSCP